MEEDRGRGRDRRYENRQRETPVPSRRSATDVTTADGSGDRRVIFCDYCLIPGHKWRVCRKRQSDLRKKEEDRQSPANGTPTGEVTHFQ